MTMLEKKFIEKVELNRGIIKNTKKYHPMLCDIYNYAIEEWTKELSNNKLFGIKFVWEVVIKLDKINQRDLIRDIYSQPKVNITSAKMCFMKI